MKFKKRYIYFLLFGFLTFSNVFHFGDYCYDSLNTFLFIVFSILFTGVFIIITFYNLYKISLKKERFYFAPGIFLLIFYSMVFFEIKYPNQHIFKTQIKSFKSLQKIDSTTTQIILFSNFTFESKTILEKSNCTKKGDYVIKNDSLYLKNNNAKSEYFDSVYFYNENDGLLISKNKNFPILKLEKRK